MITEMLHSRTQHFTREGETVTQTWRGDWATINAHGNGSVVLPVIGSPLSDVKPHLTCTDILITPVAGQDDLAEFVATYSSGGQRWPEHLTDSIASVKQVWDFQHTPGVSDEYYDYGDAAIASWAAKCAASSPAISPVPPRYKEDSTITMEISGLLNRWGWTDIRDTIGRVNSDTFLEAYTDRYVLDAESRQTWVENITTPGPVYDDTGKWLFAGFHCENIGRDTMHRAQYMPNYRIVETFIWEPEGWNTIYNVDSYQAYQTAPFSRIPRPTDHGSNFNMAIRT